MTNQAHAQGIPALAPIRADVAVIGASGRVGRRVLELVETRRAAAEQAGVDVRVVAAASSRACLIARDGLSVPHVAGQLESAAAFSRQVIDDALLRLPPRLILVDCTASAEVAARYPRWLGAGIDIVTPNKLGPSAERPVARAIAAAQARSGAVLRDSTVVGAQLPLLPALRELREAGDRVERFEAVLSGTLSYVLGRVQQGEALSVAVRQAVDCGYAEPDPARDLSGEDAARKLVILLRALGEDIELADVERVPLVEPDLLGADDPAKLLASLAEIDELWRARAAIADARHERWVYRASFEHGRARIGPERVAVDHALARLAPCENALVLHSAYYCAAPLFISGPGAGVDLTAAGVYADLLAVARRHAPAEARLPVARANASVEAAA